MNIRKMEREDTAALAMQAPELDLHLMKRRKEIAALDKESKALKQSIDAIYSLAGRASVGHEAECECSYCLIRNKAYEVWKF